MTVHYAGGPIGSRYRNGITAGDEAVIGQAIANHNARPGLTDVGYNFLLGRSGLMYEGRGASSMNGANGSILGSIKDRYPVGTRTTNPFFVSVFVCAGTDPGFQDLTGEQITALGRFYSWLVEFYKIANPIVNGHRDVRATACPGDAVWRRLPLIASVWPLAPTCQISNPAHPEWSCWPDNLSKPTLGPSSSGDLVAYLQSVLRHYGYTAGEAGRWTTGTSRAVGAVQSSNGLEADRIVGPATWAIVDQLAKAAK